ncbi:MAG: N-acyl homoserine lactonase family protein [Bradyrhizobium sp.]|uniref:N-acyl homoserine lactonase family protein n=1 Tax=Bradyrhizobium denitrificans TaxID=2734912 RepID=A0ABS5G9S4_9BRAD|nr:MULTISPECIES: N-acyl homoserine lactonase family protein [Bradyrhizobium]MBR1137920.1 N-acyl homoserine lactonase family protein [Bradyrhizobium denitrificans]MDU0953742.1 N-acyl homoserine lactonase family protein [Bradyrhizobium sp.]MDU1490638.1 N-acyl homoserine lactonase family protein [Bradyrhizobium sp.]MDU1545632.1 N-acyl homoserine lactonase family protein [Bradyrhizobium sp.]MDU1688472.1 N-acyl homoserine lactonase family protein [Bradyrhizobium sp.]
MYEVFALHVASDPHRTVGKNFFFDALPADVDTAMPQDYFFWVIRGDDRAIVVDTCFLGRAAERRGRVMHALPGVLLRELGIAPAGVTDLVMTHLHWDHAGALSEFPNARVFVHDEELTYCTGPAMLYPQVSKIYDVSDIQNVLGLLFAGRLRLISADRETLFPGIVAAKVGGHTPGSLALQVTTERGVIVLASDAAHFWANYSRRSPFPILDSFPQALRAFDDIERLALGELHRVVPGHDPLVRSAFPSLGRNERISCLHERPVADIASLVAAQFS